MNRINHKYNFLAVFAFFIVFACGVVVSNNAFAEKKYTGLSIRASNDPDNPKNNRSIFKYKLDPGSKKEDSIHINNSMGSSAKIKLYAVDGLSAQGGGYACNGRSVKNNGVGNWIKLENAELDLKPEQKGDFKFFIDIPASAEVGEHNGCIVMERVSSQSEQSQGGATIKLRSAVRVSIMIPGDTKRKIAINDFSFKHEQFTIGQNSTSAGVFLVGLINEGNVSAAVDEEIIIKNLFGGTVHSIKRDTLSLPGYNFKDSSGEEKRHDGQSAQKVIMSQDENGFRSFWGGFYKATLKISYDKNSDRVVKLDSIQKDELSYEEKTITIFLWPDIWAIVIYVLAILLAIILIWLGIRKKKDKKQSKDDSKSNKQNIKTLWGKYIVKDGETLSILADKYDVELSRMAKVNKIDPSSKLKAGQVVYVPKKQVNVAEDNK